MRIAIVLFNLGGPDSLEAVQPFLRNLFRDPAIIGLPTWLRLPLAALIAQRRAGTAKEIYRKIGNRSPIVPQSQAQAEALDAYLSSTDQENQYRSFVCMRYWHPMSAETVAKVQAWRADRILLLPLYPQLSTTTTESSVTDWLAAARAAALAVPTQAVCCYPAQDGFVEAAADLIRPALAEASDRGPVRLLFSAHGLPEKIVARGDPYPWQVHRTAEAIVARLQVEGLDWQVCYQSRVGPLKWIGPSTDSEIQRAAKDNRGIVLFPIAFVSEHSETLVELDIEYAELAHRLGIERYRRVGTVGTHPAFIAGLGALVSATLRRPRTTTSNDGSFETCGSGNARCPRLSPDPFRLHEFGLAK